MSRLKTNYEIISDKAENPVTNSEYIKHGNQWLNEAVNTLTTDVGKKANKDYVDTELSKKAEETELEELKEFVEEKSTVTCSKLGMTLNDSSNNNFQILCSAIENGKTIVVDGMYKLNINSTHNLTNDMKIEGINGECGFRLSTNSEWKTAFAIGGSCENILIDKVKVSVEDNKQILFIRSIHQDVKLRKFIVTNSYFANNIRLVEITAKLNTIPNLSVCGIDEIEFSKNICENIRLFINTTPSNSSNEFKQSKIIFSVIHGLDAS